MKYEVSLEGWKAGILFFFMVIGAMDVLILAPVIAGIAIFKAFH